MSVCLSVCLSVSACAPRATFGHKWTALLQMQLLTQSLSKTLQYLSPRGVGWVEVGRAGEERGVTSWGGQCYLQTLDPNRVNKQTHLSAANPQAGPQ